MPVLAPGRTRVGLLVAGFVVGVVLVAAGVIVAVRGYATPSGPVEVVRAYFTDLQQGDASDALALGNPPTGDRKLLTSTVLREQQRVAPIRDLTVGPTVLTANSASVHVSYLLDFPDAPQQVQTTVVVQRSHGDWLLTQTTVATQLRPQQAGDRATILGTAIPTGTVDLFPGAFPVSLDTPYLQLDPAYDHVELTAEPATNVYIALSPAGRRAALAAVESQLSACLHGTGPLTCPLPSDRYVPGSIRGNLVNGTSGLAANLTSSALGTVQITGSVAVDGSYRRLSFTNVVQSGSGRLSLQVAAMGYAVPPIRPFWMQP